jgi:hypothetical protein
MSNSILEFSKRHDFKFILLCALLVSLPLIEAPKNIAAFFLVVFWVFDSWHAKDWGGKWRIIDSIFLSWILVDIVVTFNAAFTHNYSIGGFNDIFRFVVIGWVISRLRLSHKQMIMATIALIVSTLLTILYAYVDCDGGECLELYSVGHVNHTAIFLVSAYSVALSLLVFQYREFHALVKVMLLICLLILGYIVVDTNSRAAFGLLIIVTFLILMWAVFYYKNKFIIFSFVALIAIQSSVYDATPLINKFNKYLDAPTESQRQKIRNLSYYAFLTNPVLGVGFANFHEIDIAYIKNTVIKYTGNFDYWAYKPSSHAHNLYYGYLVHGGIVAFSVMIWFWFYIFYLVWRLRGQHNWLLLSAISLTLINLGIGLVNSTLHHEHAIFTMFILGMFISQYRSLDENLN